MTTSLSSSVDVMLRCPVLFVILPSVPSKNMSRSPSVPKLALTSSLKVKSPEVLESAASLRRKEVESTPSKVAASTAVRFEPSPK